MFKTLVIVGATALFATTAGTQTFAQSVEIGPNGLRLVEPDRDRPERRYSEISERQAARIARSEGVRNVDDIRKTRSRYVVEGTDRRGNDISVSVDRRTGEVISVQ